MCVGGGEVRHNAFSARACALVANSGPALPAAEGIADRDVLTSPLRFLHNLARARVATAHACDESARAQDVSS